MMKAVKKHPIRENTIIPTTTGFQNHFLLISPPFPALMEWRCIIGGFCASDSLLAIFDLINIIRRNRYSSPEFPSAHRALPSSSSLDNRAIIEHTS